MTARALGAALGDATAFQQGRQLAAWGGLVARQYSTGGQIRLHGSSTRGAISLRTVLIQGARAGLRVAARHPDPTTRGLKRVQARRNATLAVVALATKQARIVWALLAPAREEQAASAGTNSSSWTGRGARRSSSKSKHASSCWLRPPSGDGATGQTGGERAWGSAGTQSPPQ
jgi:hypothetical protein